MGSRRVGHNWATLLSLFTFMHWRRKWQPTPVFLPGESQGWGSLMGCRLWGHIELATTEVTWQQQRKTHLMMWMDPLGLYSVWLWQIICILTLEENAKLFSRVVVPTYTPTINVWRVPSFPYFTNFWWISFFFFASIMCRALSVTLMFIFLITSEVKDLFLCFF